MTIEKALRVVLQAPGNVFPLSYVVNEGAVTITPQEDLTRTGNVLLYDVRDLIVSGRVSQPAGRGAAGGQPDRGKAVDELRQIVQSAVDANGDKGIQVRGDPNGTLAVSASDEDQRRVAELLAQLGEARGPQVQLGVNVKTQQAQGVLAQKGRYLNEVSAYYDTNGNPPGESESSTPGGKDKWSVSNGLLTTARLPAPPRTTAGCGSLPPRITNGR